MRFAICLYRYSFEVSPVLKGIASYLIDAGHSVDLIIDKLWRHPDFSASNLNIHQLTKNWTTSFEYIQALLPPRPGRVRSWWVRKSSAIDHQLFSSKLASNIGSYDYYIVVEEFSLQVLINAGVPLSQLVFILLEGLEPFYSYRHARGELANILCSSALVVIADAARGQSFKQALGHDFSYSTLPVSLRGSQINHYLASYNANRSTRPIRKNKGPLRIVHSGYFAYWSMIFEIARSCKDAPNIEIEFQGHYMGAEKAFELFKSLYADSDNISIKTDFLDDSQHVRYLTKFDAGIAFYQPSDSSESFQSSNWLNLLNSSGKVAAYLWSGLPVMTNIVGASSLSNAFIEIHDISPKSMAHAADHIMRNLSILSKEALEYARKQYDMDFYLSSIFSKINVSRRHGPS